MSTQTALAAPPVLTELLDDDVRRAELARRARQRAEMVFPCERRRQGLKELVETLL